MKSTKKCNALAYSLFQFFNVTFSSYVLVGFCLIGYKANKNGSSFPVKADDAK